MNSTNNNTEELIPAGNFTELEVTTYYPPPGFKILHLYIAVAVLLCLTFILGSVKCYMDRAIKMKGKLPWHRRTSPYAADQNALPDHIFRHALKMEQETEKVEELELKSIRNKSADDEIFSTQTSRELHLNAILCAVSEPK